MVHWNTLVRLLFLILSMHSVNAQNPSANTFLPSELKQVVLMQPTGKSVGDLPEMQILNDTTELYEMTMRSIRNSFVNEFLDLYFISQVYLKNSKKKDSIEPAYLALTENQGGFAKFGFSLQTENGHVIKPQSPYVDITVDQAKSPPDRLMSFTQLYPHEMGHIMVHTLSREDSISNNTKNVDMHFFSIITDYSTAFNEGFAEHIENVSRIYERNEEIKAGIAVDLKKIENSSKMAIKGFERDFVYPFRLGYYKASMLNWYQKYEDLKRHTQAFSTDIRFKSKTMASSKIEDQLTFRNSGVGLAQEKRNLVQLHATEGAVSSFLTHLSISDLKDRYHDADFYKPFIHSEAPEMIASPENVFTPLQNQFIKYFYVMHNHVVFNNSQKSQLSDFIDGYMESFPSEKSRVEEIYRKSLGREYSNELPPPLWFMVRGYSHRLLVFDPFDAITIPVYTFDLNAAEVEDLQTIKGISADAAERIIRYRGTNGFYTDFEDLRKVPGLSEKDIETLLASKLDEKSFEAALKNFNPELSISALVVNPLKYIFFRAVAYFLLLFLVIYWIVIRPLLLPPGQIVWLAVRYFLLWTLFVVSGLVAVFIAGGMAYMYILLLFLLSALITLLIYRKRKVQLWRTLISIFAMSLLIFSSVI